MKSIKEEVDSMMPEENTEVYFSLKFGSFEKWYEKRRHEIEKKFEGFDSVLESVINYFDTCVFEWILDNTECSFIGNNYFKTEDWIYGGFVKVHPGKALSKELERRNIGSVDAGRFKVYYDEISLNR